MPIRQRLLLSESEAHYIKQQHSFNKTQLSYEDVIQSYLFVMIQYVVQIIFIKMRVY